ncbi:MAG: hypothetical protein ACI808_001157 [Paraglaciecola sp.]|jgi:hypothetical protein
MHLTFHVDRLRLPVSVMLHQVLSELALQKGNVTPLTNALTFNFRHTPYNAEDGGWHPVEIRIQQTAGVWRFCYITDFSYQGSSDAELAKEVDFDFEHGVASILFCKPSPICDSDVMDFYYLWESNFLSYFSMEVFDEIEVTAEKLMKC